MTADAAAWAVTPDEVAAVRAYLGRSFPGGAVRALTEPSDPGQLFQVVDREGARYTVKLLRVVFDDLRSRQVPLDRFLVKHGVAARMRRTGRVTVLRAGGEDAIREGGT